MPKSDPEGDSLLAALLKRHPRPVDASRAMGMADGTVALWKLRGIPHKHRPKVARFLARDAALRLQPALTPAASDPVPSGGQHMPDRLVKARDQVSGIYFKYGPDSNEWRVLQATLNSLYGDQTAQAQPVVIHNPERRQRVSRK